MKDSAAGRRRENAMGAESVVVSVFLFSLNNIELVREREY